MLTASASRGTDKSDYDKRMSMAWQRRALEYYDRIGELRYASHFYARQLSRVRYYPAMLQPDGTTEPIESGMPVDIFNQIQDQSGGRSRLQYDYGRLMFITGEGVLFGDQGGTRWRFLWKDEVEFSGGSAVRLKANKEKTNEVGTGYRLWTPHPRHSDEADAPLRPVLDIAEELLILTASVRSTATTRMTNGMLLLSSELSPAPSDPGLDDDPENNPFLKGLTKHLQGQIENPGAPEAKVPYVLEGAFDYIREGVKWIPLHDPQTDYMERDLRIEAVKRMALGMDMPPEVLLGMTDANHWCQTEQTEILAKNRGWISQDQLNIGDEVLTLNHDLGLSEWQPVQDIYRADVVDEPMYQMQSRSHSSVSTPEHRWPILKTGFKVAGSRRRWTTSAEGFAAGDRVPVAAELLGGPDEPIHDDDFIRLLVAYMADGTNQEHGNVRIAKFQQREIVEMRRVLASLYGEDGFREHDHPTRTVQGTALVLRKAEAESLLSICDEHRAIPLSFVDELTAEQRLIFLDACAEIGDGVAFDGGCTLYQVEPQRLAAFAYAAHLSGLKVTYGKRKQQTGFGTEPLSWIRWSKSADTFSPHHCDQSMVAYTGTIWCPVTENQTWLARHDGKVYFTGNTAQQVQHDMWRSHGIAVAERFGDDLNDAYLRPALEQAGFPDAEQVVVAYDDSQVVISPDRTTVANDALDRLAISFEGYRELAGIREDMAPSEAEKMFMAALKIRNPAALGEGTAPMTTPARGPVPEPSANGNAADGPPPPTRGRPVSRQEARTAAIMGAAALALRQCRAKAGARLRSHSKNCEECQEKTDGKPNSVVASSLGMEQLRELGAHNPLALVKGGTDEFRGMLAEWNIAARDADALCERIEVFAGNTLFEPIQPDLPPGFQTQVELAQEIPLEIG